MSKGHEPGPLRFFIQSFTSRYLIRNINKCIILAFLIVFIACEAKNDEPEPSPGEIWLEEPVCDKPFTRKSYRCQVVAFYPSWMHEDYPVEHIPWERITRVIYAFAYPNPDGTIQTTHLNHVDLLVEAAHDHGVEVYFSVGGGDDSENFPLIAKDPDARQRFVNEIREFLFENCLDGVDIDWEYWSGKTTNTVIPEESEGLVNILKKLKEELLPFNLGISIDLYAAHWGGVHYFDEIVEHVDHLQVMAYDFSGPWTGPGPQSAYEDAIGSGSDVSATGLAYWVNYRGWPRDKVLLGVPFYGRDFDDQNGYGMTYYDIVNMYPDAWKSDQVANIYYNGIPTMIRKVDYVLREGFSGIMIWQITQDHSADSLSLLNAIHQTIYP